MTSNASAPGLPLPAITDAQIATLRDAPGASPARVITCNLALQRLPGWREARRFLAGVIAEAA